MSTDAVAVIGFLALFVLMLLRVPIGIAMGIVGVVGFGSLTGWRPAINIIAQSPIRTATDLGFGVVPLFLLMGAFATTSGMSRELYSVAHRFLGHFRGGWALQRSLLPAALPQSAGPPWPPPRPSPRSPIRKCAASATRPALRRA
jgi:TRAP-type mannitol/chloroaromatic compound transport system permease large subunit